jgi:adenosylmethionine-8-amino-7-oxononanoate aminotransferase
VSGATLGAAVPPADYWPRVRQLCDQRGVLLIADEVMTGFGRTGRNFAMDHWNLAADMVVAGKGIASGYAPLAAVILSRRIVDAIADGSGAVVHGLTYNAHPVSCAAGQAVLERIRSGQLVERAAALEARMRSALQLLREKRWIGDVRGIGLLWAIEFVQDRASKAPFAPEFGAASRVAAACRERGLMVYPMQGCVDGVSGDHLLLAPPAIISEEEIERAAAQIAASLDVLEKVG